MLSEEPPDAARIPTEGGSERPAPVGYAGGTGILNGPLGLRAGWGIALFFLLAAFLGVGLFTGLFRLTGRLATYQREARQTQAAAAAGHPVAPATLHWTDATLSEAAEGAAVLLTGFGLSFMERRRFGVYGLGLRRLRDLLPGAIAGLLAISLLIGLLWGLHLLVFDARLLHGAAMLRYGAAWLGTFVLVGLFEEFLFRGYIQFTLMRGLLALGERFAPRQARRAAFWIAAVLWSTLFSATHLANAGEDPFGIVMVFVAGILFSYALWRTGSLWWGVGFHLTWDWGQSFLYGVPDSGNLSSGRLFATHPRGGLLLAGGTNGPEGSVLVLPVLLLVAALIRLHPQEAQPAVEPEARPLPPVAAAATPIP